MLRRCRISAFAALIADSVQSYTVSAFLDQGPTDLACAAAAALILLPTAQFVHNLNNIVNLSKLEDFGLLSFSC